MSVFDELQPGMILRFQEPDRTHMILSLDMETIMDVVRWCADPSSPLELPSMAGLPKDVKLVSVTYNVECHSIDLLLTHAEFCPSSRGTCIPRMQPNHHAPIVAFRPEI